MRSIRLCLCVTLMAVGAAPAADALWTGREIITKQKNTLIGHTGPNGEQVYVAKLTSLVYRVLADQDGFVKVREDQHEGWLDKNNAVLLDDAPAYFTALIQANPSKDDYYARRGSVWRALKDYDRAVADYTQALRLAPNEASWYYNRGIILHRMKDYDGAIRDFTLAAQLRPTETSDYFYRRGWAYAQKKDFNRAAADCNEAIRLDPTSFRAFSHRGLVWLRYEKYDWAMNDFNEALRINPKYSWAYDNRALVWAKKGQFDQAIRDHEQALKLSPDEDDHNGDLAWLLATCGDPKYRNGTRALELAKKACDLSRHKDPMHLGTLAAAYAEVGQFDEAIRWQQKALENAAYAKEYGDDAQVRLKLYQDKKPYTVDVVAAKPADGTVPAPAAAPPPLPQVATGPLKGWREFTAPDASFAVAFPENPKPAKQRVASPVGNIDNFAYSHEGVQLTYMVSYFDFPLDGVLTLDRSAAAYAQGRQGTILDQKAITLGKNPGREIRVQLPNKSVSRVRLFEVGQRRYQIVVDGPTNDVSAEQATAFLDSFKPSR